MQTMEQSLAELILRGVITKELALSRSSRPEQLAGLLERAGFGAEEPDADESNGTHSAPAAPDLRSAGCASQGASSVRLDLEEGVLPCARKDEAPDERTPEAAAPELTSRRHSGGGAGRRSRRCPRRRVTTAG